MNPALKQAPPNARKSLLDAEAARRRSGDWGKWETIDMPDGIPCGTGWCSEVRRAYKNGVFAVLRRECEGATHLAISSLSGIRPTWHEMQRIKDEIAGTETTGVEVYPPHNEIVDQADMFHLWIVAPLPFTIWSPGQ